MVDDSLDDIISSLLEGSWSFLISLVIVCLIGISIPIGFLYVIEVTREVALAFKRAERRRLTVSGERDSPVFFEFPVRLLLEELRRLFEPDLLVPELRGRARLLRVRSGEGALFCEDGAAWRKTSMSSRTLSSLGPDPLPEVLAGSLSWPDDCDGPLWSG